MRPLIGITTYGRTEHPAPSAHYAEHYSVPVKYVDAVRVGGGVPVLLPPGETHWARWLDKVDGVIFSGGADVSPMLYGGDVSHPLLGQTCQERDATEVGLARMLADALVPALFVCRGMQVLNVALGGSLHPHLPEVLQSDIHRNDAGMWTYHDVKITPGTRTAKALGTDRVVTCSGHHQGLAEVAEPLAVSGVAPDGIIEAVEMTSHPFLVGVQWHPEMSADTDASQQALFVALVDAARPI